MNWISFLCQYGHISQNDNMYETYSSNYGNLGTPYWFLSFPGLSPQKTSMGPRIIKLPQYFKNK